MREIKNEKQDSRNKTGERKRGKNMEKIFIGIIIGLLVILVAAIYASCVLSGRASRLEEQYRDETEV